MEATDSQTRAALDQTLGRKIISATSSLNTFAIDLDNDRTFLIEADSDDGEAIAKISSVESATLTKQADAVCSVDWSWICNSTVGQIDAGGQTIRLKLDPAGPLTVSVAFWQGSPFLSFQPFRPPRT